MKKLLIIILFFPFVSFAVTAIPWIQPTLTSPFLYPNLTNGSNLRVLIGQTTEPTGSTFNDLVDIASSTPNDFAAVGIWNTNSGACASAEYDANNNHSTLSTNYLSLGITGGNFTGVGCSNNPFPAFGADSAYSIITNGNYNWALGSTSASAQFRWLSDTGGDGQFTSADTKMILTQGGFLGIGSTTPDAPLTISNNLTSFLAPQTGTILHGAESGVNARISLDTYNGGASGSIIQGRKANGTNLIPTAAILDNSLALIGGDGYGTTKFHDASVGAIVVRAEGTFTDTSAPSYLAFFTAPVNTTTSLERLRVTSTGRVGIGTTTPTALFSIFATPSSLNPNNAIFSIGSSTAAFASSTLFQVTNSGNVGIGTANPTAKLSVIGGTIDNGDGVSGTLVKLTGSGDLSVTQSNVPARNYFTGGFNIGGASVASTELYQWSNSSLDSATTRDTALGRNAAGIIEVNNGTLGTLRDITVRSASTTGATNLATLNGNVGIGTTTPFGTLSVQSNSGTGDALLVATSSGNTIGGLDNDGHRFTGGPAPVISICGTGTGTVVGDDQSGTITTATAATACTATFSKAYRSTPVCIVTDDSLVGFADVSAISTTAVTFGISSALTGGHLYYSCSYHR